MKKIEHAHLKKSILHDAAKIFQKGKRDHIQFNNENVEAPSGAFWHYRKKKKKFFYEDILQGPDEYCYLDVGTECDGYFRGKKVQYKDKKTEIFFHVVDLDSFEYHKVVFHTYLNSVLQSPWFRFAILILVIISAVMIGMSTYPRFTGNEYEYAFKIIDQIILSVFIFEIAAKWMYDFRLFWKVWWNILDFVIVVVVVFTAIFPFGGSASKALIIVRVVRAFRSLKSVSSLSSLTIVTHTVVKSAADMLNILVVLIIFMFVMAVMGVILFDSSDLDTPWFQDGLNAWFLLFICVTQDGWNSVLEEFRESYRDTWFHALAVYLILAVSIGAFVFSNLIVAVIVANLELSVKEMREERMLLDDPLDISKGFILNELEILSMYHVLATNNLAMRSQRPMKVPTLRHISLRRLQAYINVIVALEQNMLEAEIIMLDFEKIMAVILSIILQLDVYSAPDNEREREEGQEVLEDLQRISILENEKPQDAIDRMEQAAKLHKMKAARLERR